MGLRDIVTVEMSDFSGGVDRREGLMTRDARKFYDIQNYYLTPGKKLKRRPPRRQLAGGFDNLSQGVSYLNGKWYVVAPVGATTSTSIGGVSAAVLSFDKPQYSTEWELLEVQQIDERFIALIGHTFPSVAAPYRTYLHVWDDVRPTFVWDGACPTCWSPALPDHPYGEGKLGTYKRYTPVMSVGADKVFISRPNGDVSYCATGLPRIWNTRSPEDILTNGEWYYHLTHLDDGTAMGLVNFLVPLPYTDLTTDGTFAAYVCEYCDSEGTWVQFTEVSSATEPASYQYHISTDADPWNAAGAAITRVTCRIFGDGRLLRFRACAKPPVTLQSGLYVRPDRTIIGGILTHETGSSQLSTFTTDAPGAAADVMVLVGPADAPAAFPNVVDVPAGTMPILGQQRYWQRIIAKVRTDSTALPTGPQFVYALTGTVSNNTGSQVIIGVGTLFRAELTIGGQVEVGGERRTVKVIISDTQAQVDTPFTLANSAVMALRDPTYFYASEIGGSGNAWFAQKQADATLVNAGKDDAGFLPTSLQDLSGNPPILLAPMQDRLLVQFASSVQSWRIGPNAVTDMAHLSTVGISSGVSVRPIAANIEGMAAVPTANGIRLFSPAGNNKDYIEYLPVGDALRGIPLPPFRWAVWWPDLQVYLACAASGDGGRIFCLTHSKGGAFEAWSFWTFPGITTIDGLTVAAGDLYFRSQNKMYRVSPSETVFKDDNVPYTSRARWLFNHMGSPQRNKRLLRMEIAQEGGCVVRIFVNPNALKESVAGPVVAGYTNGLQRIPLMVVGPGVGFEVESADESGHELLSLGFDYTLLNR